MHLRVSFLKPMGVLALLLCTSAGVLARQVSQNEKSTAEAIATYNQMLEESEALLRRGAAQDALAGFKALTEPGRNDVPANVRARAARGIVEAESAIRREESRPWNSVGIFIRTYVFPITWPIGCLAVLGLLLATWHYQSLAFPRRGTQVSFEDLSSSEPERLDKSRVLTRSILNLMENPRPVQVSDLYMDIMPGTDEPGFGGLRPGVEMEALSGYEPSDRPMKFGAVEFTLRDAFSLFSRFFSRRHEAYLDGWLTEEGGRVVAFAQVLNHLRQPIDEKSFKDIRRAPKTFAWPFTARRSSDSAESTESQPLQWRVERAGSEARQSAIADLAAQILVGTEGSVLTHSWQSFRCFHNALKPRLEDRINPAVDIVTVRSYLARAVAYDASNWIARFHLALVLCRANQTRIALEHFKILDNVIHKAWTKTGGLTLVCSSDTPAFQNVVHHLENHPECAFLILYNKAVALSNLHEVPSDQEASKTLDRLAGLTRPDGDSAFEYPYCEIAKKLTDQSRVELSLYAIGAHANLLASGNRCTPKQSTQNLDETAQQIRELLDQAEQLCLTEQDQHWRSVQTTRAVTSLALARVLASSGKPDDARKLLRIALSAEPGLVDAYVLTAELFITSRNLWFDDWFLRAEALLLHACELSPNCRPAILLLANLYLDPFVGRSRDAEVLFRKLPDSSEACMQLANLTFASAETGEADPLDPLEWLCRHVSLSGSFSEAAEALLGKLLLNAACRACRHDSRWERLEKILEIMRNDVWSARPQAVGAALDQIRIFRQEHASAAAAS
jgi:hypothetical protein